MEDENAEDAEEIQLFDIFLFFQINFLQYGGLKTLKSKKSKI